MNQLEEYYICPICNGKSLEPLIEVEFLNESIRECRICFSTNIGSFLRENNPHSNLSLMRIISQVTSILRNQGIEILKQTEQLAADIERLESKLESLDNKD